MNDSHKPSGLPSRKELQHQRREAELLATQAESSIPQVAHEVNPKSEPQKSADPQASGTQRVSLFSQIKAENTDSASTHSSRVRAVSAVATTVATEAENAEIPRRNNMAAKGKKRKLKASLGKRIFKGFAFTTLLGIILGIAGFSIAYAMIKLPAPGEFALAQNTTVYYADGETEMGTFGELNRKIIDAKQLPEYVGQAVVASEDRSFFTNSGIDLFGIARAAVNNLRGGPLQGGSTLSQQYVERYYLDTTTGYVGKMKEAILALKINRQQSKEEILGNYLNTIYFGRGAYGIEAAAQEYFGHSATELTLSESAMLAGIIPAPSAWDPAVSPDIAKKRFERVLNLMVEDGWITEAERSEATFPEVIEPQVSASFSGTNGYLMQQIRTELVKKAGFTEEQINTGGYKIISTIDKEIQNNALQAVAQIPSGHAENLRVALSAVDPNTGEIVAEYAGADYQKLQSNAVTQDYAMAGSTMKPLGLMGYIAAGGTINDVYNGNSGVEIKDSRTGVVAPKLRNFGNVSYGYINLRYATAKSANSPFVYMNDAMGPEKTVEAAKRLGLSDDVVGFEDNLNNILGSAAVHNIDLTRAYATFANGGVRIDPHIVRQVKDGADDVIYTADTKGERVYSTEEVSEIFPALRDVVQFGSGFNANVLGRPVAGKTGTSEENRSAQFVAFIPQLVTTVSFYQVGPNGETETITPWNGLDQVTGSSIPGQVWANFMIPTVEKYPYADFDWFKQQYRQSKFKKQYVPPVEKEEKPAEPSPEPQKPAEIVKEEDEPAQPKDPAQPEQPVQPDPAPGTGSNDGATPVPVDPNKDKQ
ncbi:transglycosylase [Gleimia coleocanis DSM 15436]|uniref:Transglycosylase n=1 Tax=Gleimia coleocanis DSM 15436 TaxID=525245 RepID=C0VXY3_9ACTO|nr:transglycosylase domain-containing protein [Gleimia coleocanis]EEH64286.1 transglycosylase [Gleimia coleocanis DSM 15436]